MSDIKYGDIVKSPIIYRRMCDNGSKKTWKPTDHAVCGIFLGYRNLRNGFTDWYQDEGSTFTITDNFTAALVSPGPHQNPVYVPVDKLTKK